MSLYPSLEDLKFDQLASAQIGAEFSQAGRKNDVVYPSSAPPYPSNPNFPSSAPMYPRIGDESSASQGALPYPAFPSQPPPYSAANSTLYPSLDDYMGLDISPNALAQVMPREILHSVIPLPSATSLVQSVSENNMVAPVTGNAVGLQRAKISHGIREVILCKNEKGKVGVRVCAVNKGIFVCLVDANCPAAMAGVKFGDQILQINGKIVAGYSMDQVHSIFKKAPVNGISVILRDRPFERTVTLHKDSTGHLGFQFKNGEIIGLVIDSSAARNGLLTEHHLLEVDGQNVVGLKDKEISSIIEKAQSVVTVTIIPSYIYDHIVKKMAPSLLKNKMDHSVANL